jgi:hypothetical protein
MKCGVGPNGAEAQEKPAPLQEPQGRGTQRCSVVAGLDFVGCADATPRRVSHPQNAHSKMAKVRNLRLMKHLNEEKARAILLPLPTLIRRKKLDG